MRYIAFDSHKRYTFASVEEAESGKRTDVRIEHTRGAIREFLKPYEPQTPVAVETIGNWYWIVDEIEAAGMLPQLVHARRAKMMLASSKKTDKLDAYGMNRLQRTGTLPTVWIPDGVLRDTRELFRTRMVLARQSTRLKNRILATLAKYAISIEEAQDVFCQRGRRALERFLPLLPEHTRFTVEQLLDEVDRVQEKLQRLENRILETVKECPKVRLLKTITGIGKILSVVIAHEIGDVSRFPSSGHLAAYSGTTPRVHTSGGKVRYGRIPNDVNQYLKWAFIEAANCIVLVRRRLGYRHIPELYDRIRARKGHSVAVVAVARHLAEATFHVLSRSEPYREPTCRKKSVSSMNG